MTDAFQFLYKGNDARSQSIYAPVIEHYSPPDEFEHFEETLVVEIPKDEPGDGHPVQVYETRAPARFFAVVALPTENSMGDSRPGWRLTTGSGDDMGVLAVQIAKAASEGMIGIVPLAPSQEASS